MDKKSKIFLILVLSILAASIIISFHKYYILRDYLIQAEAECDPMVEKCFIYECDLETEDCSEDQSENVYYYKLITKKAYLFPECSSEEENCQPLVCEPGHDCQITYCDETTAEDDITCNNPEEYLINSMIEEQDEDNFEENEVDEIIMEEEKIDLEDSAIE